MKLTKIFSSVFFSLLLATAVFAQESFTDVNVEYTFDLPEAKWKQTTKPSTTSPNVEYVYGDRSDGHLSVRRFTLKGDELLSDIMANEDRRLQLQFNSAGYVAGKEEEFKGTLNGKIFNYEYISSGRNMSGRFYFVRADDKTVYVLRFTGQREKLRSIRNQTDSIARTFAIKKAK